MHNFKSLLVLMVAITIFIGCKKDDTTSSSTSNAPTVTTTAVTAVTQTTATSGGNVTSIGTSAVTARGVCWGTSQNPTISNSKTSDGTGTGSFTSSITGLTANTTYYVRAYATNASGTGYGNSVSFTTSQAASATWTKLSTSSFPALFPSRIQFVDANHGFCGITPYQSQAPVVARTTDGGATWTNVTTNCPTGSNYSSSWASATTGYLSVGKHVYKSTDAGDSWGMVDSLPYGDITAMYFTDVNTGYAVANTNYGISFKTTDGGINWEQKDTLFGARTMHFANASKGYACTDYWLGVTSDGATTWELHNYPGKVFRDICVVNANVAYTVGDNKLMKKTTDGGTTWTDVPHNITASGEGFTAVFFTSVSEGWLTSNSGIYHTTDAGLTWTHELTLYGSHYGIWMVSNQKGFVCSYTSNGSMYVYQ